MSETVSIPRHGRPVNSAVSLVPLAVASTSGVVLGVLSAVVDLLPASGVYRLAFVLLSSGFTWALASIVAGAQSETRPRGATAGFVALSSAVAAYYGLIVVAHMRPRSSLHDLMTELAVWLLIGVTAGPLLGLLGFVARKGSSTASSVAWGLLCGAVASQSVYWLIDSFRVGVDVMLLGLATVLLIGPAILVGIMTRNRRPALALGTMLGSATVGGTVWLLVKSILYGMYS